MGLRANLHLLLKNCFTENEKGSVYYQPPKTINISYPCIVYEMSGMAIRYADDNPFSHLKRYTITVIDRNPDSLIPDRVSRLKGIGFDRRFVSDNLYHTVFSIYY